MWLGPKGNGRGKRDSRGGLGKCGRGRGLGTTGGMMGEGPAGGLGRGLPAGLSRWSRVLGDAAQASEERLRCPFSSTGSHRIPRAPRDPRSPWESGTCVWGWGVVPCRPRLSSLLLTLTPPPAPLGCPSRGHTWGESHVAHLGRYQWTHLGGRGRVQSQPVLRGRFAFSLSRHEVRCGECPSDLCDPQHRHPALPPS